MIVSGLVQGVFFRAYTRDQARQFDIQGWVRNRSDGSVEIVAEGLTSNLKDFIAWCHHGPPSARVNHVEVDWQEPRDEFNAFEAR